MLESGLRIKNVIQMFGHVLALRTKEHVRVSRAFDRANDGGDCASTRGSGLVGRKFWVCGRCEGRKQFQLVRTLVVWKPDWTYESFSIMYYAWYTNLVQNQIRIAF